MSLEICWTPLPGCVSRILTVGGAGRRRESDRKVMHRVGEKGNGGWMVVVEVRKCDHIWDIF